MTATHETNDEWSRESDSRYAELQVQDDAVLIYDVKNHSAWIRSNATVSLTTVA